MPFAYSRRSARGFEPDPIVAGIAGACQQVVLARSLRYLNRSVRGDQLRRNSVATANLRYTVLIERNEDGRYTVTVPSLPGCISEGDTWDEAISNVGEAIVGYIETLEVLGRPIPVEVEVSVRSPAVDPASV